MAITNKMIIELYKAENNITCPLHTYAKWKSLGYQVKHGEKCNHRITIWKHVSKKIVSDDTEIETSKCFGKIACFFTLDQVEKIKN